MAAGTKCDWQRDVQVADGPCDTFSALSFSPNANFLAASSWDNAVRIYEVAVNQGGRKVSEYTHGAPALDACWSHDGSKVFSCGIDNVAKMLDVQTGTPSDIAQHQAPIKSVRWTDKHGGLLVTAGWDNALKYWDTRTPNPVATLDLGQRCYSMDLRQNLLVVATAEQRFRVVNLDNPGQFVQAVDPTTKQPAEFDSKLKYQTRSVAVMPGAEGFAYGGSDGRTGVSWVPRPPAGKSDYFFKSHRATDEVITRSSRVNQDGLVPHIFAVNVVAFHPEKKMSCATCGSDGTFAIWELERKKRIMDHDTKGPLGTAAGYEKFHQQPNYAVPPNPPITAAGFNNVDGGNILAYAQGYDWSHGQRGNIQGYPNKIMLHAVHPSETISK